MSDIKIGDIKEAKLIIETRVPLVDLVTKSNIDIVDHISDLVLRELDSLYPDNQKVETEMSDIEVGITEEGFSSL